MTKEQIDLVRNNVSNYRVKRTQALILQKVEWSKLVCKQNKFSRWLWSLPSLPYTEDEAIKILKAEKGYSALIEAQNYGWKVIDLCDAVDNSVRLGINLQLDVDQINLLGSWSK